MIEELFKEYEELKKYKTRCETLLEFNNANAKELYELKLKEWKQLSQKERIGKGIEDMCQYCRFYDSCKGEELPKDYLKPLLKENDEEDAYHVKGMLFISHVDCPEFEWD